MEYETTPMLAIAAEFQADILERISGIMGEHGLSIKAVAADASGLRVFPKDVEATKKVLTDAGFFCQLVEVLNVEVANQAGTFHEVMVRLKNAGVQVISSFGMGIKDDGAIFVRVDDLEKACAALDE